MLEKTQVLPFEGTEEQKQQLLDLIAAHKNDRSPLMPILQQAQDIYGYLPIEVQTIISDELGVSLEKIYGIVTFYSQFNLTPKGRLKISVCLGTACYVKKSGELFEILERKLGIKGGEVTPDGKWSLDGCRCIGACGLAPVLTINEDVHGRLDIDKDVDPMIAQYDHVE